MQVQVKVNAKTIVTADGDTQAEVFEQLAGLQEVFGHAERCGMCQSERLRYVVRENEGYKFFELHCQHADCRARFVFGQSKQHPGSLFPQRKDKDGNPKPNNGWSRYEGNGTKPPDGPAPTPAPAAATPPAASVKPVPATLPEPSTPLAKTLTKAISFTALFRDIQESLTPEALATCERDIRAIDVSDAERDELATAIPTHSPAAIGRVSNDVE